MKKMKNIIENKKKDCMQLIQHHVSQYPIYFKLCQNSTIPHYRTTKQVLDQYRYRDDKLNI